MSNLPTSIQTEAQYDAALARIDELFDAVPGTEDFRELEFLVLLVEQYEDHTYPISA